MLRTVLTLRTFGLLRDSVHSTLPLSGKCFYSRCSSVAVSFSGEFHREQPNTEPL